MSEIPKQPEEIDINQDLLSQITDHVKLIPATSPAYLADESTAELLGIDQLNEKQATAIFEHLQEQGIVAKTYTKNKGFLTLAHEDNKPEELDLATRLRRNRLGRTMLMPIVDQSVEYFKHNTVSRPQRYIVAPAKKYSGKDLIGQKLSQRKKIKDDAAEIENEWQSNRTTKIRVSGEAAGDLSAEPVNEQNTIESSTNEVTQSLDLSTENTVHSDADISDERNYRELWERFRNEVSKRIVDRHPGSNLSVEDLKNVIEQEMFDEARLNSSDEELAVMRDWFAKLENNTNTLK